MNLGEVVVLSDDKDWTWVLERPCPDCGFDAGAMPLHRTRELLTGAASSLLEALRLPGSRTRPQPNTWSALEYACHVRDTCDIFRDRIVLVVERDGPTFPDWDQDATAVKLRYDQQDPTAVGSELQQALDALLTQIDAIPPDAWDRPALRSNGSRFTLASLVQYLVHDPVHHAHDVALAPLQDSSGHVRVSVPQQGAV